MPETTCECGTCEKCKARVRLRAWRARNPSREWNQIKADPERHAAYLADKRQKREADPETYRQTQRKSYAGRAERARESMRTWYAENIDKVRAHTAVRGELHAGRMRRQPCEVCGSTERIEAHHDDYSKPLEVRWLCRRHHALHHSPLRHTA